MLSGGDLRRESWGRGWPLEAALPGAGSDLSPASLCRVFAGFSRIQARKTREPVWIRPNSTSLCCLKIRPR